MFERLFEIERRYNEIESKWQARDLSNMEEYKKLAKERTDLKDLVDLTGIGERKGTRADKTLEILETEKRRRNEGPRQRRYGGAGRRYGCAGDCCSERKLLRKERKAGKERVP